MAENSFIEYGIKYKVIRLAKKKYILFPVSLETLETDINGFLTDNQPIPFLYDGKDLQKNRYIIDTRFALDELEFLYDYDGDEYFLSEYFYDDNKDTIIYVEIGEDDILYKYSINLNTIKDKEIDVSYLIDKNIPSIVLNEAALDEILSSSNEQEMRLILEKYRRLVSTFKELTKKGITKINVRDGKVSSLETTRKLDIEKEKGIERELTVLSKSNKKDHISSSDISYDGLRKSIKEKVFGHEEEIDTFAQKLYMNYTANDHEQIESILLVGPTGTGKTETVKAACEYLDIPSFSVNASNIVPQGIKGMSIEDVILGLFEQAGYDEKKAERGLIFLDEFDKLNDSDMDIKSAVKNILLTFTSGGKFPIDNDRYSFIFNTEMTSKVYAGVFQDIMEVKNSIGFTGNSEGNPLHSEEEIRKRIIEKGYFSLEELSRISTILAFNELDRETKKRIILDSKISEFTRKRDRYKRQFGIDLIAEDSYIEAILDTISKSSNGMRSLNNYIKRTIDQAEKELLSNSGNYKKLILTKSTVEDSNKFDLS